MDVAALYVDPNGCYAGLTDVDLWDEARDARRYPGPLPVVAHPPCTRWCQLAAVVEKRYGYRRGEDGGCFGCALAAVRHWGGVLEHPAYSHAWPHYHLPRPATAGGWTEPDMFGGRACHVEQGRYGHRARKATWLYAVTDAPLPELRWGRGTYTHVVGWCKNHGSLDRPRLSKRAASATPPEFRDILLSIAAPGRAPGTWSLVDGEAEVS